jgi:hypothetical protein
MTMHAADVTLFGYDRTSASDPIGLLGIVRSDHPRTGLMAAMLIIAELPGAWLAQQILEDPAGDHDWGFSATVELAASHEAVGVITVNEVGQL